VLIRNGTIFRTFRENPVMNVKMEPKVEVSLVRPDQVSGGKKIGEVLSKPGGDLNPVWDHTLPSEDFEIGEQLHLKVLDKHNWPKGDVLVGAGSVTLSQEHVNARQIDMRVAVHKIATKAGTQPEHTGDIQIQLQLQGEKSEPARGSGQLSDKPVGRADPRRFEMNDTPAMPTLSEAAASFSAQPQRSATDGAPRNQENAQSDRDVALRRAGLDVRQKIIEEKRRNNQSPPTPEDLRLQLVVTQYWERGVRSRKNPILCTAGLRRWLKTFCCRAGCCRGESAYDGFKRPGPATEHVTQDKEGGADSSR